LPFNLTTGRGDYVQLTEDSIKYTTNDIGRNNKSQLADLYCNFTPRSQWRQVCDWPWTDWQGKI